MNNDKDLHSEPTHSTPVPVSIGSLSKEQLDLELQKGFDSLNNGKVFTADEVDEMLKKEFGI